MPVLRTLANVFSESPRSPLSPYLPGCLTKCLLSNLSFNFLRCKRYRTKPSSPSCENLKKKHKTEHFKGIYKMLNPHAMVRYCL